MTHHDNAFQQGSLFDCERETKAAGAETTRGLTLLSTEADRLLSTKRIAEVTGKEHRNVLRDVREMCAGLSITPVVATAQNRAIDSEGVIVEQYANGDVLKYHLNEHYCIVLATGYNVKLRNLIVGEWEQLKKKLHALPDFTDPAAAALAFADQAQKFAAEYQRSQKLAAEKRVLEEEKAVLAPKAHVADMLADSTRLYTVNEVAKALHLLRVGPNLLFELLRKRKVVFRRDGVNHPYQRYVDEGYLAVVMKEIHKDGFPQMYPQVMITGKGCAWVMRLVEEERERSFGQLTEEKAG
jgi:phage antirepressor YoqD-like protein